MFLTVSDVLAYCLINSSHHQIQSELYLVSRQHLTLPIDMIGQIVAQPIVAGVPSPLSPKHLSSVVFPWWSLCCQRSALGWGICHLWIYYFPHTLKKNAMAYKKYRHKLNKISLLLLPKTTRIVRYFEEKSTLLFRGLLEVLETILKSAWQIYYLWNKEEHGLN